MVCVSQGQDASPREHVKGAHVEGDQRGRTKRMLARMVILVEKGGYRNLEQVLNLNMSDGKGNNAMDGVDVLPAPS